MKISNAVRGDNKDDNKFPPFNSKRKVFFDCENVFYNFHTTLMAGYFRNCIRTECNNLTCLTLFSRY